MAIDLSLNKLPWYGQVILFTVLGLAGVGVFYYFYVMPAQDEMAGREQRLTALRADIRKGMTTATKLAELHAELDKLQAELSELKTRLPEQKDVAELLRRIQTLASQSNLAIKGFKPMATATKQLHTEWPIALQLDGTYHNLGIFFDQISKFPRIINVGNLAIKGKDKPEPNSTIAADCTATTFVLLEQKPAAGAAAKK